MFNLRLLKIRIILSGFAMGMAFFSCQNDTPDIGPACQPMDPSLFVIQGDQQGLTNALQKEVWLNTAQDADTFSRIKLSAKWLGWRKESVKSTAYQKVSLLRSPGCKEAGLFSQQKAFDLSFVHGFNILQNTLEVPGTPFQRTQMEAYFDVSFAPQTPLVILQDPDNNRYLKLWQAQGADPDLIIALKSSLPPQWRLRELTLAAPFVAQLTGSVQQLETPDSSVFLGPLPADFKPETYGQWNN